MIGDANRDSYTGGSDSASFGPKLGFLGELEAGFQSQQRSNSLLGMEQSFRDEEQEQVQRARQAGIDLKSLGDDEKVIQSGASNWKQWRTDGASDNFSGQGTRPYRSAARYFVDGGEDPALAARIAERDEAIDRANKQNPGLKLKTYRDLFGSVQDKAKQAEETYNRSPTNILGDIGGFIGSTAASLDPRTDPLNFATLPFGGVGKTAVARIAEQAGVQGAATGLSEGLGLEDNRRLLGLENGFGRAVGNTLGAAAGGAIFQGAGEGIGLLARRWFGRGPGDHVVPPEPGPAAPLPPREPTADMSALDRFGTEQPYRSPATYEEFNQRFHVEAPVFGPTRAARARTGADMDYVGQVLDDWHGGSPGEIQPPKVATDTAAAPYPTSYQFVPRRPGEPVDVVARRVDPETFQIYDKLQRQADAVRDAIKQTDDTAARGNAGALAELDATIAERNAAIGRARSDKVKARLQDEITTLSSQREGLAQSQLPSRAELRDKLVQIDEQMRDHAPLVSRAYAQAKDQMGSLADSDAARFLDELAARNPEFRELPAAAKAMVDAGPQPVAAPITTTDRIPLLAASPELASTVKGDAADKIAAVAKAGRDNVDALSARFKQVYDQVSKEIDAAAPKVEPKAGELDPNIVEINGREFHLDNDRIEVPLTEGDGTKSVTVREFLDDLRKDDLALEATHTCTV